jgi:hypothetical protein
MDKKKRRSRPAGRPPKIDKDRWGQITCVLRKDTIDRIRAGVGGGKFFGEYLQAHLDRFPPPSFTEYMAFLAKRPLELKVRGRKTPVIVSAGAANRVRHVPKARSKEQLAFDREIKAELSRLK